MMIKLNENFTWMERSGLYNFISPSQKKTFHPIHPNNPLSYLNSLYLLVAPSVDGVTIE